jgi:hypothetical protein
MPCAPQGVKGTDDDDDDYRVMQFLKCRSYIYFD